MNLFQGWGITNHMKQDGGKLRPYKHYLTHLEIMPRLLVFDDGVKEFPGNRLNNIKFTC